QFLQVDAHGRFAAECAHEHAVADPCATERVVLRQAFETLAMPQVRPAIADMHDGDELLVDPGAHDRGAHARAFGLSLRALEEVLIRQLASGAHKAAEWTITILPEACRVSILGIYVVQNRVCRHLAGDLAGRAYAHAIAHEEQTLFRTRQIHV